MVRAGAAAFVRREKRRRGRGHRATARQAPQIREPVIESKFGAPITVVRENLQEVEQNKYIRFVREQIDLFKDDFPDYIESESNRQSLVTYLQKKGWPITRKNLGIAYTDLLEEGDILVVRQAEAHSTSTDESAAVATVENQPAPGAESGIDGSSDRSYAN